MSDLKLDLFGFHVVGVLHCDDVAVRAGSGTSGAHVCSLAGYQSGQGVDGAWDECEERETSSAEKQEVPAVSMVLKPVRKVREAHDQQHYRAIAGEDLNQSVEHEILLSEQDFVPTIERDKEGQHPVVPKGLKALRTKQHAPEQQKMLPNGQACSNQNRQYAGAFIFHSKILQGQLGASCAVSTTTTSFHGWRPLSPLRGLPGRGLARESAPSINIGGQYGRRRKEGPCRNERTGYRA
ncbi:hypothetical protein VWZ88_12650 [Phaeobacter sp. JH20_36]|uniref:hypothetical protein n=1 Tax=unclassified Phaeobacter TaxID=2621772 RepID=UPI003A89B8A9